METKYILINESGERIDKFISEKINISRERVKKLITEGHILLNGKPTKVKHKIKTGQEITINIPSAKETHIISEKLDMDIVFEDENMIVINKANGVVVHPAPGHQSGTLVNGLLEHCKDLSGVGGVERPGVVHRIDKNTTGILVFAKNDKTHQFLSEQFQEKTSKRTYHVIVHGVVPHAKGTINAPIGRSLNDRKKNEVTSKNSKESITHFEVIEKFKNATYLKVKLETGRTHQIRVHMNYIKHPVIGDDIYGLKKHKEDFGQYLHAKDLGVIHPVTKKLMSFTSEIPKEFTKKLEELRSE